MYMFHCHNLIHQDNTMIDVFNVTALAALGYASTEQFSDPMDTRFQPQASNSAAFEPAALTSAVQSLASMNPYGAASSLSAAEVAFYSTAGYHGDASSATTTTTVAASSSGYGFPTTTATTALTSRPTNGPPQHDNGPPQHAGKPQTWQS